MHEPVGIKDNVICIRRRQKRGRPRLLTGAGLLVGIRLTLQLEGRYSVSGGKKLSSHLGIDESSVLVLEVFLGHPTGGRASSSDVDGDFVPDEVAHHLTYRRPADRRCRLGNYILH